MPDLDNAMTHGRHPDEDSDMMTECRYCGEDSLHGLCEDCQRGLRKRNFPEQHEQMRNGLAEIARGQDPRSWWK